MKDIAKQMRHIAVKMDNPYEEYCIEAADEIERLREALKEVDKALVAWMGENSPIRNVLQDYIKTALKGDEG